MGPASSINVPVTGVGGVPSSGVTAVVLNVTVTEPTAPKLSHLVPQRQPSTYGLQPELRSQPGQDVPNLVVAKVGSDGKVSTYNNAGSTHVIFDVVGWYVMRA